MRQRIKQYEVIILGRAARGGSSAPPAGNPRRSPRTFRAAGGGPSSGAQAEP